MRIFPPGESCAQSASTSSLEPHLMWKETDGLNLKKGTAPIAMNGWPASSKATISQSPDGVSVRVDIWVIREPGNRETYHSAASRACLSNHRWGVICCIVF